MLNIQHVRGALRTLLYGTGDELDLTKFEELSAGFESYTMSTSSVESSRGESNEGRNAALEQLANVVLSEDRNYVQDLLLRETAVALDASLREAFITPLAPIQNLPTLPAFRPFTLPLELAKATLELQSVDGRDAKRLENIRILSKLGTEAFGLSDTGDGNEKKTLSVDGDTVERLVQEAAKRRLALARIGVRLGSSLASVHAERLRERGGVGENEANDKSGISDIRARLAVSGAENFDNLADIISSLDGNLGRRGY